MREAYTLKEIEEKLEHEKYLRKENQELYEELQVLRKCSDGTNDLANEYKKRIDKTIEYIKDRFDEDKGIWIIDCYELLEILESEEKGNE